jgi:hypothetical protein
MTAATLLSRLLAATPAPPTSDDLDGLLAMATSMMHEREAILVAAAGLPITTAAESQQLSELQTRQRAWDKILDTARERLSQQRLGATKMRAYAATLAAGCR